MSGDGENVVDDTKGGGNTMEDVGATTDAPGSEAPSTTRVNFESWHRVAFCSNADTRCNIQTY